MPYIQGIFWGVGLTGMGTVTTRDLNSVLFRCESALHQDELSSLGLSSQHYDDVGLDMVVFLNVIFR